jgi:hypothetical protein
MRLYRKKIDFRDLYKTEQNGNCGLCLLACDAIYSLAGGLQHFVGKDMEGSGRGLGQGTILTFIWTD